MNTQEIEKLIEEHVKKCKTSKVKFIYFTHEEWDYVPKDNVIIWSTPEDYVPKDDIVIWSTPDIPPPKNIEEYDIIYCPKCGEIIWSKVEKIIGKNIKEACFPINMIFKVEPLRDEE